ncbi:hypothetical protein [Streptomyces sp. NPDC005568]
MRLPAMLGVAVSLAGCGGSGDEGLPVRVVNESVWDARVMGCPPCGEHGLVVEGDPGRTPAADGGSYFGWTEERAWPVTYRVVVRGVETVCPFIDPGPGKAKGAVGTRDVIYQVDLAGKCVAGPGSMDDM